jgi:hypothetical protein
MMPGTQRPNVVSFHLDNLGYGESCCFGYGEQEESNRQGLLWTNYRPGNILASMIWAEQTC